MVDLFAVLVLALMKLFVLFLIVFSLVIVAVMAWQATKWIVARLPKPFEKFLFPVIFVLLFGVGVLLFG